MEDLPQKTPLLTPKAAVDLYHAHGVTRGRSLQTLARMRMGQSKITGPEYVRTEDGYIFYDRASVLQDIDRITGLPRFTSVAREKAAGVDVPNKDRDYGDRTEVV